MKREHADWVYRETEATRQSRQQRREWRGRTPLTLLPANLALRGSKINLLPIPFIGKGRTTPSESSEGGFCRLITRVVTRYPVISIIVIGAPMVVATAFYFQIQTGINGVDVFPEGTQTREVFFVMEEKFSFGLVNPTDIVIDGDIDSPPYRKP